MRIVHCLRAPVGGVLRHVRDLAAFQASQGHDVGLICDSTTGGPFEEQVLANLAPRLALGITRIPMQRQIGPGDIIAAPGAYRSLKERSPDILHGHGAKGGFLARFIGTMLRGTKPVRRFYSPHGGSLHYDAHAIKGQTFFAVERWLEKWTDGLFFVCDFERDTYIEKVGPPKTSSVVAYNGLYDDEFESVTTDANARDLLFVGTLRDLKGPDIFIEAIALAQAGRARPITATIVGEGEMETSCRALVRERNLELNIEFRPAMPAREAFGLARMVVVPSRAESFPYIVLEALGAQKPVIATNVGGIPEIMGTESPALATADIRSVADTITNFIDRPDALMAAMPDHLMLRRKYSVKAMAQTITSAYRQAAQ